MTTNATPPESNTRWKTIIGATAALALGVEELCRHLLAGLVVESLEQAVPHGSLIFAPVAAIVLLLAHRHALVITAWRYLHRRLPAAVRHVLRSVACRLPSRRRAA